MATHIHLQKRISADTALFLASLFDRLIDAGLEIDQAKSAALWARERWLQGSWAVNRGPSRAYPGHDRLKIAVARILKSKVKPYLKPEYVPEHYDRLMS